MNDDLVERLREVTAFYRAETGDRVAAAASLSEEAACRIETLEQRLGLRGFDPVSVQVALPDSEEIDLKIAGAICNLLRHFENYTTEQERVRGLQYAYHSISSNIPVDID